MDGQKTLPRSQLLAVPGSSSRDELSLGSAGSRGSVSLAETVDLYRELDPAAGVRAEDDEEYSITYSGLPALTFSAETRHGLQHKCRELEQENDQLRILAFKSFLAVARSKNRFSTREKEIQRIQELEIRKLAQPALSKEDTRQIIENYHWWYRCFVILVAVLSCFLFGGYVLRAALLWLLPAASTIGAEYAAASTAMQVTLPGVPSAILGGLYASWKTPYPGEATKQPADLPDAHAGSGYEPVAQQAPGDHSVSGNSDKVRSSSDSNVQAGAEEEPSFAM